jgi:RimJ/RimL family protein N-acetyltransferase
VTDLAPSTASIHPPERIATARLVLRRWRAADAPLLRAAIDASLPELQRWMAWARDEPAPVDALALRLATFEQAWDAGHDFAYGIFPLGEGEAYGSAGIHRRGDDRASTPDHVEIGYWIRSDVTGRGYASEAARALVDAAARLPGTSHVEIRCDPLNLRSAAVARRIGLTHARTIPAAEITVDGAPRDTMVWVWRP